MGIPFRSGMKTRDWFSQRSTLLGQRFNARQLFSFQEFKGRAAAGRDVCHFVRDSGGVDRGYRVAAAHNRNGSDVFSNRMSDLERPPAKWRNLEYSHRTIPD